jgi:hypothetical protein
MRLLLDTCTLLWARGSSPSAPRSAAGPSTPARAPTTSVEVDASHLELGFCPDVLELVARRLAAAR